MNFVETWSKNLITWQSSSCPAELPDTYTKDWCISHRQLLYFRSRIKSFALIVIFNSFIFMRLVQSTPAVSTTQPVTTAGTKAPQWASVTTTRKATTTHKKFITLRSNKWLPGTMPWYNNQWFLEYYSIQQLRQIKRFCNDIYLYKSVNQKPKVSSPMCYDNEKE